MALDFLGYSVITSSLQKRKLKELRKDFDKKEIELNNSKMDL